jgi:hypothetical protein
MTHSYNSLQVRLQMRPQIMYIVTYIGFSTLACLIILRGPQCSGKTEVSQRLRETLDKKQKKRTCLLKLNEINTERFKKSLNEALDKKYKYVVGELNYEDSHSTDIFLLDFLEESISLY